MKEKKDQTTTCDYAEELVTYLYGELSEHEAAQFRRHMEQCGSCKRELAAFSRVRQDVIEWRNLSLPSFDFQQAPLYSNAEAAPQKRSALAALRQFFTLSPIWMRAATAAAALAICALLVFTAIHFSERPGAVVQVTPEAPAQAQPDAATARRTDEINQSEPQEAKEKQAVAVERPVETAQDNRAATRRKSRRQAGTPLAVAQQQRKAAPDKAKASQEARQQLAELVQTSRDDDNLPRLSDLIDDSSGSN